MDTDLVIAAQRGDKGAFTALAAARVDRFIAASHDVDGAIVIIDAMYRPTTPTERIEVMRAIAESATFELP